MKVDDILNQLQAKALDELRAAGHPAESVVTVVLFKMPPERAKERDWHTTQTVDDTCAEDSPDELFCESAARLGMSAREIATRRRS